MTIIPFLVERHAEEAAFLWLQRRRAVRAPHYTLKALADLDERVEAHLDGLRIAGESGWEVASQALAAEEGPGELVVAAVLALESGRRERVDGVLALAAAAPPLLGAAASAFGWLSSARAAEQVRPLLGAPSPRLRQLGIAAAAVRRLNPGPALEKALDDADPGLRARALRAVGELGVRALLPRLRQNLTHPDPSCRLAAAWSAARLGEEPEAVRVLRSLAEAPVPGRRVAVQMAVRRMGPPAAGRWLADLAGRANSARLALAGYGALGDPAAVPRLLQAMSVPALARPAAEALRMIAGIDPAYDGLEGRAPEGFESGPSEDPADKNVALDPDENLPWPDAEKVAQWWAARAGQFRPGTRYLLGKPLDPEWLNEVLRAGRQRERAAAALELALLQPDGPLCEVRMPAWRPPTPAGE